MHKINVFSDFDQDSEQFIMLKKYKVTLSVTKILAKIEPNDSIFNTF